MRPGGPAVAFGKVWHRRNHPEVHQFTYQVNQVWFDPDRPQDLCHNHRLWSINRRRPITIRRRDYFHGDDRPIGPAVRAMVAEPVGHEPSGPVRLLTQPRTWGWLFNPISVYLVWDQDNSGHQDAESADSQGPIGAVLEVTNTPWKERHHYAMALLPQAGLFSSRFAKQLHVSPFLDEDFDYLFSVGQTEGDGRVDSRNLSVAVDVYRPDEVDEASVETRLELALEPATPRAMTSTLYRNPLPTQRVSLGIHWQAARLARKRIPFVPHPEKRT